MGHLHNEYNETDFYVLTYKDLKNVFLKTKSRWGTILLCLKERLLCMLEYTQNIPKRQCKLLHFGSRMPRIEDEGMGEN